MIGSSRSYAIGMAHFQIAGGLQMLFLVNGLYLLFFATGVGLYYYMDISTGTRSGLTSAVVGMLLIFEAVVLVVLGSFRVAAAIRTDFSSRMIESHRLMPVPGWRAVMGYLFGGTTHAIAFGALNVVLAYIFAGVTKTSLMQVTFNQAMLFSFAVLVWTFTALGTLLVRQMYFIASLGLLVGGCFLSLAYTAVPGFALLVSPMIGPSVFSFSGGASAVSPWAYPASIGGQAAFGALLFAGACRRYRGTYRTTFSDFQAVMMLVTWCLVSMIGLILWDGFHFGAGSWGEETSGTFRHVQVTASVAVAMLVAFIPMTTIAARENRKGVSSTAILLACVMVIAAIPLGIVWALAKDSSLVRTFVVEEHSIQGGQLLLTALVVGAHVMTLFASLVLLRRVRELWKWGIVSVGLVAYWMIPLMLELIRATLSGYSSDGEGQLGALGTMSPLGLLIRIWNGNNPSPVPVGGLALQWVIAVGLGVGMILMGRRRRDRGVSEVVAEAVAPVLVGAETPVGLTVAEGGETLRKYPPADGAP